MILIICLQHFHNILPDKFHTTSSVVTLLVIHLPGAQVGLAELLLLARKRLLVRLDLHRQHIKAKLEDITTVPQKSTSILCSALQH